MKRHGLKLGTLYFWVHSKILYRQNVRKYIIFQSSSAEFCSHYNATKKTLCFHNMPSNVNVVFRHILTESHRLDKFLKIVPEISVQPTINSYIGILN